MTHLMRLDETLNAGRDTCAVVGSAAEMAAVLAQASPSKARGFVVAMHERACGAYDEAALAFWHDVLTFLALDGVASGATHPSPSEMQCHSVREPLITHR